MMTSPTPQDPAVNGVAFMCHELRTPLCSILGYSELLIDPATDDTERRAYIDVIRRNGRHLTHLLDTVLDYAKLESGHLAIDREPFSVAEVVQDVERTFSNDAASKKISLRLRCDETVPRTILGDHHRVKQVWLNLVGNAVKFVERGHVELSVSAVPTGDGSEWLFESLVADSGIGMSTDERRRLFQEFTQTDGSIARRFGGTGIGLRLSKLLAERMGGTIELVDSEPGHGSVFRFTFLASAYPSGKMPGEH